MAGVPAAAGGDGGGPRRPHGGRPGRCEGRRGDPNTASLCLYVAPCMPEGLPDARPRPLFAAIPWSLSFLDFARVLSIAGLPAPCRGFGSGWLSILFGSGVRGGAVGTARGRMAAVAGPVPRRHPRQAPHATRPSPVANLGRRTGKKGMRWWGKPRLCLSFKSKKKLSPCV